MGQLYKKIIIICDFNPSSTILETDPNNLLTKLKKYINLLGKGNNCNIYRYNEIMSKGNNNAILIDDIDNFDPTILNSSSKIGITASASSPEILVSKILGKIGQQFDLNIIESEYEKENIHFKMPQKLKEVV